MPTTGQANGFASIVGANVKSARQAAGLTQRELAARVGGKTTVQRISDWERGDYKPNDENLVRLAVALDRELPWFFVDRAAAKRRRGERRRTDRRVADRRASA